MNKITLYVVATEKCAHKSQKLIMKSLNYSTLYFTFSFKVVERPSLMKTYSQWQNTGCVDLSCPRYTPENHVVLN